MKKIITIFVAISVYFVCTSSSCTHDKNNNVTTLTAPPASGTWVVSYYNDKGSIETARFTGYTFDFPSSGVITATHDGQVTIGSYGIGPDDDKTKMVISLGLTDPNLTEISNDYQVIVNTPTELDLKDDNSSHIEEIHFTKQ